jgi:hypothetical protein
VEGPDVPLVCPGAKARSSGRCQHHTGAARPNAVDQQTLLVDRELIPLGRRDRSPGESAADRCRRHARWFLALALGRRSRRPRRPGRSPSGCLRRRPCPSRRHRRRRSPRTRKGMRRDTDARGRDRPACRRRRAEMRPADERRRRCGSDQPCDQEREESRSTRARSFRDSRSRGRHDRRRWLRRRRRCRRRSRKDLGLGRAFDVVPHHRLFRCRLRQRLRRNSGQKSAETRVDERELRAYRPDTVAEFRYVDAGPVRAVDQWLPHAVATRLSPARIPNATAEPSDLKGNRMLHLARQ